MKKIVCIMVMLLSVMMTFAQGTESTSVLHDVVFERRIDFLNLEGESYDSVLVKFNVGDVFEETVKVDIWDKHGVQIYNHTFRKMDCVRSTKDFDDNVIIVGKPSIFFLMIKKCDDGPKLCVIREREGITKSPDEYLWEYLKKQKRSPESPSIETGKVYDVVEHMPQFPGGPSAMFKFLADNIHYPEEAEKKGAQGRVIIAFIVECDGSVSNPKVTTSAEEHLDKEALRLVRAMPKWTPGTQDGHPVRVKYTVPVTFRLQ
jgi:TonB family protein